MAGPQKGKTKPGESPVVGDRPGLAEILAPLSPDAFFAEYYDRKPVHIAGTAEKFANVMSWPTLTALLNMTAIWSSASLQLALDRVIVPPAQYCRTARNRDGRDVLQPDGEKVMELLRSGASLVANDIDTLTPALAGFAAALEDALDAKVQANLYCSWRERQAFDSHFDTHDVYAVHVAGEKLWRLYETRMENPIAHPRFKTFGQDWHDRNKGTVAQEVVMRPGDLLYIPRGQYHDALALSDGTIHIAFGATHVIGLDLLDLLANMAVEDTAFRANMPRSALGEAAVAAWLADLAGRLGEFARSGAAVEAMRRHQALFRYPRGGLDLPVRRAERRFRVTAPDLKVMRRGGDWVLAGRKAAVPIPSGMERPVEWIVARSGFAESEFTEAFPALAQTVREDLLKALAKMKVVAVA